MKWSALLPQEGGNVNGHCWCFLIHITGYIISDSQPSLQHNYHIMRLWLLGYPTRLHHTKQSTENQRPLRSELHQRVEGSRLNPYGELPHNSH